MGTGGLATPQDGLVERERELAAIADVLESVERERGCLCLIRAPAGMGKTRVLEAARGQAAARGLQVLSARGSELERELPFGLVTQLFQSLVIGAEPEERDELLAGAAAPAASPLLGGEPDEHAEMDSVLHGLYWLAARVARHAPLLLAVDDAHWGDDASLRWLAYLVEHVAELPLALVVATRPPEANGHPLPLEALTANADARTVELAALTPEGVGSVVRERAPHASGEFVAACHEATGGNPLFLSSLLASLAAERGGLDACGPDAAARALSIGSEGVSRSVLQRLRRLPAAAEAFTRAVSVLDSGAELALATELAGLAPEQAADAVAVLRECEILAPEDPLAFFHPIVGASIAAELVASERMRAHGRAARMLAERGAAPEDVAPHLLAADSRGDPWVVEQLEAAARRAAGRGAAEAALRFLRRALEEPPPPGRRAELLMAIGSLEATCVLPEAAARLAAAIETAQTPEQAAAAAVELGRVRVLASQPEPALDALERALGLVGHDRELRLRLESTILALGFAGLDGHRRALERSDRLAAEAAAGETPAERRVLAAVAWERALATSAPAGEVAELAERALAGERLLDEEGSEAAIPYLALNTLVMADRPSTAEVRMTVAIERAGERHSLRGFRGGSCWRAWARYSRGALGEAEDDARAALEIGPGHELGLPVAIAVLLECLLERGAAQDVQQVLSKSPPYPELAREEESVVFDSLLVTRARVRALAGDPAGALEDLRACGRRQAAWGFRNPANGPWRAVAARILAATGERDEAHALVAEEVEIARAFGAPRTLGMALRAAAGIERGARQRPMLEEAVAVLERSEASLELARALVSLGMALRRDDERGAARDALRRGLELAHACGASLLADRARRELVAAGGRPRRRPAVTRSPPPPRPARGAAP